MPQQLNLELGGRWSDYNTAGAIWTYKGLIDWTVVDAVRIRGGYQLANRAPNVAELFTGQTTSVVGFPGADPCMANTTNRWGNTPLNTANRAQVIALCSQLINNSLGTTNASPWHTGANFPNNIVGPFPFNFPLELANITGNPELRNEEAETWTAGVVFKSPFERHHVERHAGHRLVPDNDQGRDRADQRLQRLCQVPEPGRQQPHL